jgi:sRNA-binding carbon storage regulator CsrA
MPLVINRKRYQAILIPALGIRIECDNSTKLVIDAPDNVKILREELVPESQRPVRSTSPTSQTSQTISPPLSPAVNCVPVADAKPVQLWNRIKSRKSAKPKGSSENGWGESPKEDSTNG